MATPAPAQRGSFRLFRLMGIDVFVHWLWFAAAWWELSEDNHRYSSIEWKLGEYLLMFLIVLLHEFGHALACRSVGGKADRIVLWVLGGVAFVAPPRRPGAVLWSVAAGPLVNVLLLPVFIVFYQVGQAQGWPQSHPDLAMLAQSLCLIDFVLLIFNLLPIYPLDGGQILQSLLWLVLGEARSLMIVSVVGMIGVAGFGVFAVAVTFSDPSHGIWLLVLTAFVFSSCWRALTRARQMGRLEKAPVREGFLCPSCHKAPPVGMFWRCSRCGRVCDTFDEAATCGGCNAPIGASVCLSCGTVSPLNAWRGAALGSSYSVEP